MTRYSTMDVAVSGGNMRVGVWEPVGDPQMRPPCC